MLDIEISTQIEVKNAQGILTDDDIKAIEKRNEELKLKLRGFIEQIINGKYDHNSNYDRAMKGI